MDTSTIKMTLKSCFTGSSAPKVAFHNCRIVDCTTAFERFIGYSKDELTGMTEVQIRKLIHPTHRYVIDEVNKGNHLSGVTVKTISKDKQVKTVLISTFYVGGIIAGEKGLIATIELSDISHVKDRLQFIQPMAFELTLFDAKTKDKDKITKLVNLISNNQNVSKNIDELKKMLTIMVDNPNPETSRILNIPESKFPVRALSLIEQTGKHDFIVAALRAIKNKRSSVQVSFIDTIGSCAVLGLVQFTVLEHSFPFKLMATVTNITEIVNTADMEIQRLEKELNKKKQLVRDRAGITQETHHEMTEKLQDAISAIEMMRIKRNSDDLSYYHHKADTSLKMLELQLSAALIEKSGRSNDMAYEGLRGSGERIMLIDDNTTFISVMTEHLDSSNYRTNPFTNPVEALKWYEEQTVFPDIILIDLKMPFMGGDECIKHIREINPDALIILITGDLNFGVPDMREAGAQDLIHKPTSGKKVLRVIKNNLRFIKHKI